MASNQTGIFIGIKAFLPTGKSLDEQFAALSLVKQAHETGDYAALLSAAKIDEVKTEQKTRRVEDAAVPADEDTTQTQAAEATAGEPTVTDEAETEGEPVPETVLAAEPVPRSRKRAEA